MKEISFTIDGKKIKASEGDNILFAALDNGIYIPNLCAIREKMDPSASCRLCFVEVEGEEEPVAACTRAIQEGMVVNTRGKDGLRLARTSAELLLSSHPVDCGHCLKNKSCELQRIAKHLSIKLKTKRFRKLERKLPVDNSCPLFTYNPNKCVLCGRCVWVCRQHLGVSDLGFAHRGFERGVTTFGDEPIGELRCRECKRCLSVCPSGAFVLKLQGKT